MVQWNWKRSTQIRRFISNTRDFHCGIVDVTWKSQLVTIAAHCNEMTQQTAKVLFEKQISRELEIYDDLKLSEREKEYLIVLIQITLINMVQVYE